MMVLPIKDKKLSKILIVLSNPSIGGTETFIASIVPYFGKESIEVDLLNTWHNSKVKDLATVAKLNYRELTGNNRYISIKDIKEIVNQVRNSNYRIILSFGIRASILLRLLKPWFRNILIIEGLRGLDKWRKWYHIWPDWLTEFSCDMFVPNSEAVARLRMQREKTPARKIVTIKNGIDISYFDRSNCAGTNRLQLGLPTDKILITTVGNFRYQKGHDFLLRVIKEFSSSDLENVHFIWAGEGPLKKTLEKQIEQIGITEKISILGWTSDVRRLLACSDILAMPSREEGMPRCLMEAMSMGLPCVATNVGGTAEVIEDEKNGFLSDFDDIQVFGNCLKKLIDSPELRREIGMAARKRIVENFNIEIVAKKYIKLFELICTGERDGRKVQDILDIEFKTKTKK
jgi:glycosyltransferase involved in cell wall biosynthesis